METFKINGIQVPKGSYQSLLQLLYVVGKPPKAVFDDRHVSGQEILNFLDASGNPDKFLLFDDLAIVQSRIGIKPFDALSAFLKRHGFNLFSECYDLPSWLNQYDPKKPAPFFWHNRDFVAEAIQIYPSALQFAGPEWQADRGIVLSAVRYDGRVLKFAALALKKDFEVVLAAVRANGEALLFADPSFRSDRKIVLEAVRKAGWVLSVAGKALRGDEEVVLEAVKSNGYALEYAAKELRSNRDVVFAAVRKHGRALQFASPELRKDPTIVLTAVRQEGSALEFAHPSFLNQQEFLAEARQHRNFFPDEPAGSQENPIKPVSDSADFGWLADIFGGTPLNQVYKETQGGYALNSKRALQLHLFAGKIQRMFKEEPKDPQILRRFGPDMLNFYHFAMRFAQQSKTGERFYSLTMPNGEKGVSVLFAFREPEEKNEPGTLRFYDAPFRLILWTDQALDMSYRLVPSNFPSVIIKEGRINVPPGKLSEVEIFSSQWLEHNEKLAPTLTQYRLLFVMDDKTAIAAGKPIEIQRGVSKIAAGKTPIADVWDPPPMVERPR